MSALTLTTFRAVQRVLADITSMKVVHGVTPPTSGSGASAILRPQTDQLAEWPACVLGSGPISVTPGPVTRLTWTLQAGIWRPRDAFGPEAAYDGLVTDIGSVIAALMPRGKGYSIDARLQSLKPVSFAAIDGIEWPVGSNAWYLVLPFELEAIADYDVAIAAA